MKQKSQNSVYLVSVGIGFLTSVIFTVLITAVFAGIMGFGSFPHKFIPLVSGIIMSVMGIFGGYATAKVSGKKGLLLGALLGVMISFILTLLSVLFTGQSPEAISIFKIIVIIVSAMTGGVLAVNTKKR